MEFTSKITIYRASAGSGKTFNLAYEYILDLICVRNKETGEYRLNLARFSPDKTYIEHRHRGILAITFTNKATQEMKERIIAQLDRLSQMPDESGNDPSPYVPRLQKILPGVSRADIAEAAHTALIDLLYDYHFFNVSTIDSFFQIVLRTFARELERPGDYAIELDDNYAIRSGVGMMFDDFNHDADEVRDPVYSEPTRVALKGWLGTFIKENVSSGKKFNVFNRNADVYRQFVRMITETTKEDFKVYLQVLREYFEDGPLRVIGYLTVLMDTIAELQMSLRSDWEAFFADLRAAGLSDTALDKTALSRINNYFMAGEIYAEVYQDVQRTKGIQKILGILEADKPFVKGASAEVNERFVQLFRESVGCTQRMMFIKEIADSLYELALLACAWGYIDRFRNENNLVLLSDTTQLLSDVISEREAPFIYERLGMELQHFLIDEFQDTSRMQWDNIKPLIANSLSENYDSLIIGDEKQSIYRFRNSDSSLLHHRVEHIDFPGRCEPKGYLPEENTNHRSAGTIVRFNNTLFRRLAQRYGLDTYGNVAQSSPDRLRDAPAYITVRPYDYKTTDNFDITARAIIDQHNRGYAWSDIMVLVRKRKEGTDFIEYCLANNYDIPFASAESLSLYRSSCVNLIVSLLRMISKANQRGDSAEPRPGFLSSRDRMFALHRFEYFLSQGLQPSEALDMAMSPEGDDHADMSEVIQWVLSQRPASISTMVDLIIGRALNADEVNAQITYVTAFHDVVMDYADLYGNDLASFLKWWDANASKLSVQSSAAQDAVSVMTIHKAKGLESKCVHIPFGSDDIDPRFDPTWVEAERLVPDILPSHKDMPPIVRFTLPKVVLSSNSALDAMVRQSVNEQLADNINTLYVAFTRAGSELNICYIPDRGFGKDLMECLASARDDSEQSPLYIDTCPYLSIDPEHPASRALEIGEPTRATAKHDDTAGDNGGLGVITYDVNVRTDTMTHTAVQSITYMADREERKQDDDIDDDIAMSPRAYIEAKTAEEEARQRGNILHAILSYVKHADRIDRPISRGCREMRVPYKERAKYAGLIRKILVDNPHPMVAKWFASDVTAMNERSLYEPNGDYILRPDRIVEYPDGTIDIVDYKFTSAQTEEHRKQVRAYGRLLRSITGREVRTYLFYPLHESNPVVEVTD